MFPTELPPSPSNARPAYRDPTVPHAGGGGVPWASRFEELTVTLAQEAVEFVHVRANSIAQNAALVISTVLFVLFVVAVMPVMGLSSVGNALWFAIGLIVLAVVGLLMHARIRTTRLRLDRAGLTLEQGTAMDSESIVVLWAELASVSLEPVSERDGRKGMCLRLTPREGAPINTLEGVSVGELNDVRRVVIETMSRHRLDQAAPPQRPSGAGAETSG